MDSINEPLVQWNTDLLEKFLKQVVASRHVAKRRQRLRRVDSIIVKRNVDDVNAFRDHNPIDDVTEVILMSDFSDKSVTEHMDHESMELDEAVCIQLRDFVQRVAACYRDNPFHNFEHASHVAMSASKIINRIVRPEDVDYHQENIQKRHRKKAIAKKIHQSTFGISSDDLMQFALVFSALIHDVDHTGVSNAQLVKEGDSLAVEYNNKSVAEQRSIRVAWDILMEDQFSDLRSCIYTSEVEKLRFRQLIVNAVISTDIFDKDLQTLRKKRWNRAFHDSLSESVVGFDNLNPQPLVARDNMSHKATVVFEYIIQASDVAHTMQHWHIYSRWNERFFEEQYRAFVAGREEQDPSLGWFLGEIWFFDNYIIPLARKLETCGVFGVSSDEYLNYALENRSEWELKGRDIVQKLVEKYSSHHVVNEGVVIARRDEEGV
jgi:hypothetical protein